MLNQLLILPILLSSIASGLVLGYERQRKYKLIGIRTYILVIASASVITFVSSLVDPMSTTRITANILTGIGFLCSGLIIKHESDDRVENLTTSVSVWLATAVGICYGYQLYIVGIALTICYYTTCMFTKYTKTPKPNNEKL